MPDKTNMTCRKGPRGERVGLLGFGMMRLPTVDGKHANAWQPGVSSAAIDQAAVNRFVRYALDHGVTYFDTAPVYCRGESERVTGRALAASGYPRASYQIATKLSNFAAPFQTRDACRRMFENSLKTLGTDYVDFYLLHSVGQGGYGTFMKRFVENGAVAWACEERRRGRIRNLGFSFHGDPRAWNWMMANHAKYHWDFAQIQLNYVDWAHAAQINPRNLDAARMLADLDRNGIPAVVMEPLLGGRLAKLNARLRERLLPLDPEATPAKWAFRFAGASPRVLTVLSGMQFRENLEENVKTFSPLKPLAPAEREALEKTADAYVAGADIPCNACDYCMPCPYGLDIPGILTCSNRNLETGDRAFLRDYEATIPKLRRAERCTGCGQCLPHCPQAIDIVAEMRRIDARIEKTRRERT